MTTHPTDLDTLLKEERAKAADYAIERYKEALAKRPDYEAHWAEAVERAEAAEASALTARRDGERDGLLKAAEWLSREARSFHGPYGNLHSDTGDLLVRYVKALRTLASTVPGGEETPNAGAG